MAALVSEWMRLRGMRYLSGLMAAAVVLAAVLFVVADRAHGADTDVRAEAATDNLAFVVHHTDTSDVIADPEFPDDNMSADGQFVVVKLTVINTSADAQVFHSGLTTLSDGATQYPVDAEARHYVGADDIEVASGQAVDAALVFDVPRGIEPESIVLREGPSSHGVSIEL